MKPTHSIPLSLYIHFPWCLKKCPYCDFNSHEFTGDLPEQNYINALLTDLEQDINFFKESRPIESIFMGGGTPSIFSPEAIHSLLENIKKLIPVNPDAEITLEANPSTFENQKFSEFNHAG
ncbi:MAG: radical SAM protein, partial [Methylococcales bacterium]